MQKVEGIDSRFLFPRSHRHDRSAHGDQRFYTVVGARRAQADRRAKGKSCKDNGQVIFAVEPVEGGADIFDFAVALVVLALAQARSAEVEAKHGESETVQRLHSVKDDFIVERAAE